MRFVKVRVSGGHETTSRACTTCGVGVQYYEINTVVRIIADLSQRICVL